MRTVNREMETMAIGVHTSQATLYTLAIPFHAKRRRWLHVSICVAGVGFHIWSAIRHANTLTPRKTLVERAREAGL